ncbi:MAG: M23 family metallopeptidase, partial [Clostridia bacterium]|nr:M23 family metallopeptidase [Clostridia bacterium]
GYDNKNWPKYNTRNAYHSGTDISAPVGTPVYAAYSGKVVKAVSLTDSYGKHVIVECNVNGKTVYMYYCHLNSYNVKVNDYINAGSTIGTVGETGNSDGPHLHFEVRDENMRYGNLSSPTLNPYDFLPKR